MLLVHFLLVCYEIRSNVFLLGPFPLFQGKTKTNNEMDKSKKERKDALSFFNIELLYCVLFVDDHSRVVLETIEDDPSSSYINGNYIDVSDVLSRTRGTKKISNFALIHLNSPVNL